MTITLSWKPILTACPDCGDEHDCVARVTCPVCNYHCGSDLAEQWINYCETLALPECTELLQAYEAEGEGGSYKIMLGRTCPPQEKDLRAWISAHGEAEEEEILALVMGCANPLYEATEGDLAQIVLACECTIDSPTFYQLPAGPREDTQKTLELAREAEAAMAQGKTVWLGTDDDGYYIRVTA